KHFTRAGYPVHFAAGDIDYCQGCFRLKDRKHDFAAIGRPVAVFFARTLHGREELARASTLGSNGVKLSEPRISFSSEENLRSVGRPAANGGADRRACKLDPLASVRFGPPQGAIGVGYIGDLASILREGQKLGGNAAKIGFNPPGHRIEASEFRAGRGTHGKNLPGVSARDGGAPVDRAGSQRIRGGGSLPEETM